MSKLSIFFIIYFLVLILRNILDVPRTIVANEMIILGDRKEDLKSEEDTAPEESDEFP